MVDKKRNPGVCECCGQEANVKTAHGIKACTMCSTFMARVKKHPFRMAAEFERLMGRDYFPQPKEADDDQLATLTEANEQLARELMELESYRDKLEDEVNSLRRQVEQLQDDDLEMLAKERPVNGGSGDLVPLSRLLTDRELLGAINTVVSACG